MTTRELASVLQALRELPYGDTLRRGPTATQQATFTLQLQKLGFRPPRDLLRIWSQCNGSDDIVFGYYRLLSLSEMLREKKRMDDLERDGHFSDWLPNTWWNLAWLPIAESEGDLLCVDLQGRAAGNVIDCPANHEHRDVLYPSLAAWLTAWQAIGSAAPATSPGYEAFFTSRKASQLHKSLCPGFPRKRNAKPAKRRHSAMTSSVNRVRLERGSYHWEIERSGVTVRVSYGRAYSSLQRSKKFPTAAEARSFMEKQIASKQQAGFQRVADVTYL